MPQLLLGSQEDLAFYQAGQLSPATATLIASRYQWLAIGLVLGNVVTLLVTFVLTLLLLLNERGSAALVVALLLLAVAQLGAAVWVWLAGSRVGHLPVQRLRGPLGIARRSDRLLLRGREFRLHGRLLAAPEADQQVSAYWVQPPLWQAPLALALLAEDNAP